MKYFRNFENFKIYEEITNAENSLIKAINDKKDFIQSYREILLATKKAKKKDIFDDDLKETLKNTFLKIVNRYHVDSVEEFNKYVEKLVKDRNFISLKTDFSEENKIYFNYLTESLGVPEQEPLIELKPENIPAKSDNLSKYEEELKNIPKTHDLDETSKKIFDIIVKDKKVPELKMNEKGDYVHFLQDYLKVFGYNIGDVDGIFGVKTQKGVSEYQSKNNIDADGIVGENTWKNILHDLSAGEDFSKLTVLKSTKTNTPIINNAKQLATNQKVNIENFFESKINEAIDNFKGVEMIISKPYDEEKGFVTATFTKDGKPMLFKKSKYVTLPVIKDSGKFSKITQEDLLQNLSVVSDTTKTNNTKTTNKDNQIISDDNSLNHENSTDEDFQFKDSKGNSRNFSELAKVPNSSGAWFNTETTMRRLILNNNNRHFILSLNKLYEQKKGSNLIHFMVDVFQGANEDFKIYNTLLEYIINPNSDAMVINSAVKGVGTEDQLLQLIINKRSKESDDYKKKIADEYLSNYNESLLDALEDDLDTESSQDQELIKKIIPDYLGSV
jgi:hypothetical protein